MKTKLKFFLMAASIVVFTISCSKNDDKTTKDYLTGKSCWKITKLEEQKPDLTWIDITSVDIDSCDLDNCLSFKADSKYTLDAGVVKCDPNDPQILAEANWALTAGDKNIAVFEPGTDTTILIIESISADQLILRQEEDGESYRITLK